MRKQINLFRYSFDCIARYKMRSIVVIVTFLIATMMVSSVLFAKDGLEREAEISVRAAPDLTLQFIRGGRIELIPISYIEVISNIEGIEKIVPRVWGYIGISNYVFTVIGIDPSQISGLEGFAIEEGRFLAKEDKKCVVVGKLLAGLLDLKVGDTIIFLSESIEAKRYQVIGIFSDQSSIYTADMIIMLIEDARDFFKIPSDYASDLLVYVNSNYIPSEVAAKMSSIPNLRVLDQDLLLRGYKTAYASRGGIFVTLWVILLIAAALISLSQMMIVGQESRFEVGLLKAFGFSTLDIIEVRLIESLVLGFFASSLGMLLGYLYVAYFNAPGLVDILLGWAFLPKQFKIPVYVSWSSIFSIYAITIIPLLITTIVPAWLNAITDPELAMRRATA
ncbi:MAG: ABC transporter permease [Candidatus Methanomethyliaceae archaeon]|nr:ABC transporter permease [Candidatus Methanomethyliaceae archaeon]MDW7971403.1 ABC transporter permease [Nitrososphaerota archaeon]